MQDHTRSLTAGLVAAGHRVEVIADRHPDGLATAEIDGARWNYLPYSSRQARLPRRNRQWLRASYEEFLRLHTAAPFDLVHSESSSAVELLKHGVHHRLPVVVKWHGNALSLARAAARRFREGDRRVKIREAKELVWLGFHQFQHGHWYRFRPCHWMVPSRFEFEDTKKDAFLRRELGHVVANGVDPTVFQPLDRDPVRRTLGLDAAPLLVCVGRLEPDKGYGRAIAALKALDPATRLVIVGDGPDRGPLERLAFEVGVGERVFFTGALPHGDVSRYMAAADVFVFPTERAEAAPLVLPQAMACGAAVVASEIGSISEVVRADREAGLLVPPGDVGALAHAVRRLLEDPRLRTQLGETARRRVLDEYSLDRMIERTLAIYATVHAEFTNRSTRRRRGVGLLARTAT